jgi:hypothetical protein
VRRFSAAFKRFILSSRAGFSRRHNALLPAFSAALAAESDPLSIARCRLASPTIEQPSGFYRKLRRQSFATASGSQYDLKCSGASRRLLPQAGVAELADAADLKSEYSNPIIAINTIISSSY